jgi:hypothetical protein
MRCGALGRILRSNEDSASLIHAGAHVLSITRDLLDEFAAGLKDLIVGAVKVDPIGMISMAHPASHRIAASSVIKNRTLSCTRYSSLSRERGIARSPRRRAGDGREQLTRKPNHVGAGIMSASGQ